MATETFSSLSMFRLYEKLEGQPVKTLEDFIDPEKHPIVYELKHRYPFHAKLFVAAPDIRRPAWVEGFGDLAEIPEAVSNSAVLIVAVKNKNDEQHFAFTFGFGRYLLRPGSFRRNYGLHVALNAIYPRKQKTAPAAPTHFRLGML